METEDDEQQTQKINDYDDRGHGQLPFRHDVKWA
jgi:hypothetical protein